MAADRYAPTGQVWLCMMCGKTTKDCYGEERGWDESCALNCILVDEATKQPTEAQAVEFAAERERRFERSRRRNADFIKSLSEDTYKTDPDLLALARLARAAMDDAPRRLTAQEDRFLREAAKRSGKLVSEGTAPATSKSSARWAT